MTKNPSERSSLNNSTSLDNIKPNNNTNLSFKNSFDTCKDSGLNYPTRKFTQLPFRQNTLENRLSSTGRLRNQLLKYSDMVVSDVKK